MSACRPLAGSSAAVLTTIFARLPALQYTSQAKQQEVERELTARGLMRPASGSSSKSSSLLLPETYWLGLRVAPYQDWPTFAWLSGQLVPTDSSIGSSARYSHWGTYLPGSHLEPNNIFPNETCGCANASQALPDGLYGWADAQCGLYMPFVCEMAPTIPPPPSPTPPVQRVKYTGPGGTYQLVTELLDWGAARTVCQDSEPGADLVTWVGRAGGVRCMRDSGRCLPLIDWRCDRLVQNLCRGTGSCLLYDSPWLMPAVQKLVPAGPEGTWPVAQAQQAGPAGAIAA